MTTLWMSHTALMWCGTILIGGLAAFWLVWDSIRLRRYLPRGRAAHDEIFGSLVGVAIAILGLIGVARYHWGG